MLLPQYDGEKAVSRVAARPCWAKATKDRKWKVVMYDMRNLKKPSTDFWDIIHRSEKSFQFP